jgi:hypothetical protein
VTAATQTTSSFHVRWPCERFYWGILDTSLIPNGEKATDERLRFLLEPELPVPLDDVHAVFVRGSGGPSRVVACAISKEILRRDVPAQSLTLGPSDAPAFVRDGFWKGVDSAGLNLLVGEFEPATVRSWRRRTTLAALALVALGFALTIVGIERRVATACNDGESLRSRRESLVTSAIGPPPPGNVLPQELRLAAELRTFRQTRRQSDAVPLSVDATDHLVDLLSHWPLGIPARIESIVVSDAAIHIRGLVSENDSAQRLATATSTLAGLRMSFPSVQAAPDGVRFGLEWHAEPGAKK